MDNIEQTIERITGHWDHLCVMGVISRATYEAGINDLAAWAEGRRKLAATLQAEYQADRREDQDGHHLQRHHEADTREAEKDGSELQINLV